MQFEVSETAMAQDLTSMLSTPLLELRDYWLEEMCCRGPLRSPLWFHAARRSGWLLSDLALDHTCEHCGTMPALALVPQDKAGLPVADVRVDLIDRFDEG